METLKRKIGVNDKNGVEYYANFKKVEIDEVPENAIRLWGETGSLGETLTFYQTNTEEDGHIRHGYFYTEEEFVEEGK